jgi:hypothetical protein
MEEGPAMAAGVLGVFKKAKKKPRKILTEAEILELERLIIRHADAFSREPSLLKELSGGEVTPGLANSLAEIELAEQLKKGGKAKNIKREPKCVQGMVELLRNGQVVSKEEFAAQLDGHMDGLDARVDEICGRQKKSMKHISKSTKNQIKAMQELSTEYEQMVAAMTMQKRMMMVAFSRLPPRVRATERVENPGRGFAPPPSSMGSSYGDYSDSEIDMDDD